VDYDLIIAGGGLAGASLAKNMAEHGSRVLVLEREKAFRDRIRGEAMHPWGVVEAKALGIFDAVLDSCGHVAQRWKAYFGGELFADRDIVATNPYGVGEFHFYHPDMQETVLEVARSAGAEVHRGARVSSLDRGENQVGWTESGTACKASGRLIVGADGSRSMMRRLAGFEVSEDPERMMIAGAMMENTSIPQDSVHQVQGSDCMAIFFPQGNSRCRAYLGYPIECGERALNGEANKSDFRAICREYGVPDAWLDGATLTGPLAQFHCADRWVNHPAADGVVLIGDAAAKPDPTWGTGLSLTLVDVRTLRDELLASSDWDAAIHRYAEEHDRYYQSLHAVETWFADLLWDQGPEADARRMRLIPTLENPGAPDIIGLGPDSPTDEAALV
jgi:2-polyprenyl-6-methoxyphenol hydroxylase-like FAD-dependent oxidoreductase